MAALSIVVDGGGDGDEGKEEEGLKAGLDGGIPEGGVLVVLIEAVVLAGVLKELQECLTVGVLTDCGLVGVDLLVEVGNLGLVLGYLGGGDFGGYLVDGFAGGLLGDFFEEGGVVLAANGEGSLF